MDRKRPPARSAAWPVGLLVALCFTTLPLFLAMAPGRPALSDVWRQMGIRVTVSYDDQVEATKESAESPESRDILLGGLLSPDIDQNSCLSRYQSSLYRKPSPHPPSPYLVSRLRRYEALHRKCGLGTLAYNRSLAQLAASAHSLGVVECSYLVWAPSAGRNNLGDRMLSVASAFLYALLTGRVLLAHVADDMAGLFCEPFPGASWELPRVGFPVRNLTGLHRGSECSYGNMAAARTAANDNDNEPAAVRRSESNKSLLPPYVYVHLERDYQQLDQRFFCDDDQAVLAMVNWLVLRSDLYFAPGLFLVPQFEDELRWMFPAADRVWELVARYYTSYMSNFEEKIGLRIAAASWHPVSAEEYIKQIAACTTHEKILPEVDPDAAASSSREAAAAPSTTAVLVSAAQPQFADWLKAMYSEHATATGEAVSVLQLSVGKQPRNQKALAEMFLQSYCDVSVVSGWSTVVYVSHGLAGVKPWLLLPPRNVSPCIRMMSMEPCFHVPPNYDCRAKKSGGLGAVLQHVRHCEDVADGLKLFD